MDLPLYERMQGSLFDVDNSMIVKTLLSETNMAREQFLQCRYSSKGPLLVNRHHLRCKARRGIVFLRTYVSIV